MMASTHRAPAIEVERLRKVYRGLVAVDNVSFVMYRGEAFGFLGPNGAGKSTVVKMLTGLVRPTSGTVRLLGQPVSNLEMRRRIGYLPELPNFHRWLRAKEFLEFHGRLYGMRGMELEKRCHEVLAQVGLDGRENQRLGTFSKGMMQRIGLAQAILNRPDLVLLDELVSGLDPVGQRDMRDLLHQLKAEGMSIFLNSHQLADVEALCDRVAIINEGRILKVGAPQSLFDEYPVFAVRVSPINNELLHRLGAIALAVRQDEDDPALLYVEVQRDEQAADIAEVVYTCGSRLYGLAPHHRSLEQLFLRTIDASRRRPAEL
ncbi:MAG TPA: ABC transporter ATP-binding protein [Ktedonobacteraceae bacterium]|nr:ABC transporter ATP-binding protein [Ktedonobacteraceae bacterium]